MAKEIRSNGYTEGDVYHLRCATDEDGYCRDAQEADKRPQVLGSAPGPNRKDLKLSSR